MKCMASYIIRPTWRRPTYSSVHHLGRRGDGPRTERVKSYDKERSDLFIGV